MEITEILSRIFGKNFVKVTVLLNKLLKSWFDEIFLWWERFPRFSTLCIVEFTIVSLLLIKISVKSTFLLNSFTVNWFHEIFFCGTNFFISSHTVLCKCITAKRYFWFHEKNGQNLQIFFRNLSARFIAINLSDRHLSGTR